MQLDQDRNKRWEEIIQGLNKKGYSIDDIMGLTPSVFSKKRIEKVLLSPLLPTTTD